ncbi:transmembrane protein [Arabidopsis thaliana]|jgi:hypothetical protein|uniref:Transmembrane protein n=1 Tax=Arabidopsis thaliana TaxID=3702 RepID=Q9ZUN9_ARATH|nr:uncharacterized protein AT2G19530 [Arabidopsis thaliana]AAD10152.1 unknown protein [Arabidopsis thaliana]AEC06892.1 transmembrane protein [Arabidopsis thaliana]|eukprot:NP_179543.1 transmembrane protein [Arabidopsis thaliana]
MESSPSGSEPPQKVVSKLQKVGWRATMIFNLGFAAYIFAIKREKDIDADEKKKVKKGSEARHKGVKKGAVNTEIEKKGAEETDKAKEAETAIPEKEETKLIPELDPLFEFTDATDQSMFQTVATEHVKVARKPIPEDEQKELFKWILEEKRKIEPKDRKEKKQIDEEKAILKQFIRAERIPKLLPDDSVDSSLRDWDKFFSK